MKGRAVFDALRELLRKVAFARTRGFQQIYKSLRAHGDGNAVYIRRPARDGLRVQRKENLPDQRSVAGRVNRNRCPHARARARRAPIPAPADIIIIDRPSSIVAPNQTANNNPLKRKGDVDQQPYSRLEPVGLLGAARSHSSLESALASRARQGSECG